MDAATDAGTTLINSLPNLVTGASNVVTATHGQAAMLPAGTQQITGNGISQVTPPFNWTPILVAAGGLILLAILIRRR